MRFNSKSVTLNNGISLLLDVQLPTILIGLVVPDSLLKSSIDRFNKMLDKRRNVKEVINGIELDILKLNLSVNGFRLWVFVNQHTKDIIQNVRFTFRGKLIYENDNSDIIEDILIEDVLFKVDEGDGWQSVFSRKKELTLQ